MKRIISILIICFICIIALGSCSKSPKTIDASLLDDIEIGMSFDEVVAILGSPDGDVGSSTFLYRYHLDNSQTAYLDFRSDSNNQLILYDIIID